MDAAATRMRDWIAEHVASSDVALRWPRRAVGMAVEGLGSTEPPSSSTSSSSSFSWSASPQNAAAALRLRVLQRLRDVGQEVAARRPDFFAQTTTPRVAAGC